MSVFDVLKQCVFWLISSVAIVLAMISSLTFVNFCSSHNAEHFQLFRRIQFNDGNYTQNTYEDVFWLLGWDALLLGLFICQHSIMASDCFKLLMYKYHSTIVTERAVYVIMTSITIQTLIVKWKMIFPASLWLLDTSQSSFWWCFFTVIHFILWTILFGQLLMMDLPELIGLKQVYYYSLGIDLPIKLKSRPAQTLYKHMRHPGTICLALILWIHPVMSLDRWLLAAVLSLYNYKRFNVHATDYTYINEQAARKELELRSWSSIRRFEVNG